MLLEDDHLPFEIDEVYHGFAKAKGILRYSDDTLVFEFQVSDNLLEVFKSKVKTIRVPMAEIKDIVFKKSWFRARLIFHSLHLGAFEKVPGHEATHLSLKIHRRDRATAEAFYRELRKALEDVRLRKLAGEM